MNCRPGLRPPPEWRGDGWIPLLISYGVIFVHPAFINLLLTLNGACNIEIEAFLGYKYKSGFCLTAPGSNFIQRIERIDRV